MKVLKFGGSSVADAENIKKVAAIVQRSAGEDKCVVVYSAFQGTTDDLIQIAKMAERGDDGLIARMREIGDRHLRVTSDLFGAEAPGEIEEFVDLTVKELADICEGIRLVRELSPRTLDRVLSFGEIVSSRIISAYLNEQGLENQWKDARDLIRTNSSFGAAAVDLPATETFVSEWFAEQTASAFSVPGFIARDVSGATTTLGRGGSDYTAAILAAALNADLLEIWTDVSGMMSADPRFVRNVKQIDHISYREAMELSHFGAKVIYPPTIQPVMAKGIPVLIKNTFAPTEHGTLIEAETRSEKDIIRGISSIDRIAVLTLEGSGMVGVPGFSRRLFEALARRQINVVLITQSSSEHSISVAIDEKDGNEAKTAVDAEFEVEVAAGRLEPLRVEAGFSILALVGDRMKEHTGVSGRMFSALGHNGINIHAIAQGSSERNISAIIASSDVRKAVNTLHEEFFSDGVKQVNLFIAGVGTVGGRLIEQLRLQNKFLREQLRLNVRVIGLANSSTVVTDDEGIDLANWRLLLSEPGAVATGSREHNKKLPFRESIIELIAQKNFRNSVFVDATANADIVSDYPDLLEKSVSIVACNKVACSSDYETYSRLKDLAREYNTNFLFETNVGAGLPVINTLNDLLRSGDRVRRIEAVLSGTLNFVFNNYDGSRSFSSVVREAQAEGYTEPDPRLDLSGTDVARKILILAREAGNRLEMDDIEKTAFLPESCLEGSVEDFYCEMEKSEGHFRALFDKANSEDRLLKYIASCSEGKASVGLQFIERTHDFANLSGKDNAVLFYTDRYREQPLVIKGAGAGADVTAAGVFADIIRAAR